MTLVDANLLLYVYDTRAVHHAASKRWLEALLSGRELVGFAWLTLWAFVRIATNPRVYEHPLSVEEAEAIVESWLARPVARILDPGERHWDTFRGLTRTGQCTGALVMDAVLAAIAIEHGATLATTDRDFSRFDGLSWRNPIA